jgi:tetratricopeptide (TPR) repeat protein
VRTSSTLTGRAERRDSVAPNRQLAAGDETQNGRRADEARRRGLAAMVRGQYRDARNWLRRAAQLCPSADAHALVELAAGQVAVESGDRKTARTHFMKALEYAPGQHEAMIALRALQASQPHGGMLDRLLG